MCGSLCYFTINDTNLVTDCFIETGTYMGWTTQQAATHGFPVVKSIEVCERNYRQALENLKSFSNVKLYLGSCRDWLPVIIEPDLPTTFFLDGLFQGGPDDEQDTVTQCPLLEELAIIINTPWKKQPYIIIDDSRMYNRKEGHTTENLIGMKFNPEQWPTVDQIKQALPGYELIEHDDRFFCLPKK